jgi:uncharacterized protein YndB with AHSA1/START domain
MPTFRATQHIRAPVHDVFRAVVAVHEFPRWNPARNPSARRLSPGAIGEGARFELEIKGFGKVPQTLEAFVPDSQVRIVPHIRQLRGGHLFRFAPEDGGTRVDHELEMVPKGAYALLLPMMWRVGRKNLRDTMEALRRHLESPSPVQD